MFRPRGGKSHRAKVEAPQTAVETGQGGQLDAVIGDIGGRVGGTRDGGTKVLQSVVLNDKMGGIEWW